MAFANSSVSDIIATTIQSRSGELADNVTNNNPLLLKLKAKGNVRPFSGGNLILKQRSRYARPGKTYRWTERCCAQCHRIWRYEYELRKYGKTKRAYPY